MPFPPDFIGGTQLYCKQLSLNLANRKRVENVILTSDLLKQHIKNKVLQDHVEIVYKRCFFYLWNKNPIVNILHFLKKHKKDFDIVHVHGYYFFTTLEAVLLKLLYKFPLVLHVHGGIQTYKNHDCSKYENLQLFFKKNIFDPTLGKLPFKKADKIISVNQKDLDFIRQKYNLNSKDTHFIPNGVDLDKFKPNPKKERKYITLIATRLSYIKGIDIFIKIVNELYKKNQDLKFLVIGNGNLKNMILNLQNKIPIKYYPDYPHDKIQNVYNKSKMLLITSRFEGTPNVLYESFASETPVISTNVGGISGVISHNKNGYLFDINNYKESVKYILDLVNDDEKIASFGKNGRELMQKDYSWDVITDKIYNIYKELYYK